MADKIKVLFKVRIHTSKRIFIAKSCEKEEDAKTLCAKLCNDWSAAMAGKKMFDCMREDNNLPYYVNLYDIKSIDIFKDEIKEESSLFPEEFGGCMNTFLGR